MRVGVGTGVVSPEEISPNPVNVYPNPVKDNLFVKVDENITIKTIKLKDLSGRFVKQSSVFGNEATMPVSELPKGIYLLEVESDSGVWTEKVIKE